MEKKIDVGEIGQAVVNQIAEMVKKSGIGSKHVQKIVTESVALVIEEIITNYSTSEWDDRMKKATFYSMPLIYAYVESLNDIANDHFVDKAKEVMDKIHKMLETAKQTTGVTQ